MKAKELKWKAQQLKLFWYWMGERHKIYHKKKAGKPWPWTKDPILLQYKFTNVYRQLDRVTEAWTERHMKLVAIGAPKSTILFHCLVFRLFNWPPTYDALSFEGLLRNWSEKKAVRILAERENSEDENKRKIFTGAYIIPSGGSNDPKIETICRALTWCNENRSDILKGIRHPRDAKNRPMLPSMEATVNALQNVFTVGPFIAYELACDLRHTAILSDASDILSWANPGPGAKRGIHRLLTGQAEIMGSKPNYIARMRELLLMAPDNVPSHVYHCEWPFELREIEHSLCEFDKYMRVKNGEGRPRSRYRNPDEVREERHKASDAVWTARLERKKKLQKEESLPW